METLFSIERFSGGAKFNNYSKQAKMIVEIGKHVFFVQKESFLIIDEDFEISNLKISFT